MTWASLRMTYAGLPEDQVRAMLGGNAIDAYDLEHAALTDVAARIHAPSYDDINGVRVDEKPPDSGHLAFRTFGFWA